MSSRPDPIAAGTESASPAIEAIGLRRSFGALRAVDDLDLRVLPGEAYGLLGPDGAGKTTLLRLLVGALRPDAGRARVCGHDLAEDPEAARARIGYLAGRFSLYGDLKVVENLRFFGEVRGLVGPALEARAAELLDFVGLTGFEDRLADRLSGGMKQKLGLACALIHRPPVLLLDEPSGGLDPLTRRDLWKLIARVVAEGAAVLISTPYMDEAARCSRVGLMREGRLMAEGRPRELTAELEGRVLELKVRGQRARVQAVAAADPEVDEVLAFGDRFHLLVSSLGGPMARLPGALAADGVEFLGIRPIAPSLEDAFIARYSAEAARELAASAPALRPLTLPRSATPGAAEGGR